MTMRGPPIRLALAFAAALGFTACHEQPEPPPRTISGFDPSGHATPAAPSAERADALYNDAMEAYELGNKDKAAMLIPHAIAAYQALGAADADSLYHLSTLELAARDPAGARKNAEKILAANPRHLLALAVAAQAAHATGDEAASKGYWKRYVEVYDGPRDPVPEYQHHSRILPIYRQQAAESLGKPAP